MNRFYRVAGWLWAIVTSYNLCLVIASQLHGHARPDLIEALAAQWVCSLANFKLASLKEKHAA